MTKENVDMGMDVGQMLDQIFANDDRIDTMADEVSEIVRGAGNKITEEAWSLSGQRDLLIKKNYRLMGLRNSLLPPLGSD